MRARRRRRQWLERGSSSSPDGSAQLDSQVTLISTLVLAAIEPDPGRWPLAGDQLYVDFDLVAGEPADGALLEVGDAVLEVSPRRTSAARSSAPGSGPMR
jgi:hypothetical protein